MYFSFLKSVFTKQTRRLCNSNKLADSAKVVVRRRSRNDFDLNDGLEPTTLYKCIHFILDPKYFAGDVIGDAIVKIVKTASFSPPMDMVPYNVPSGVISGGAAAPPEISDTPPEHFFKNRSHCTVQ